jgi:hypothetical protein
MAVMPRARAGMQLEIGLMIAALLMLAAFIIDWPRAVAGLVFGSICRFLPYGTILVPVGVVIISALFESFYTWIGHTPEPHLWKFLLGIFPVAGTASTLFITIRNLKDRF